MRVLLVDPIAPAGVISSSDAASLKNFVNPQVEARK